jgi:ubiquinone/menaquinone biosynthesis C-methylase UbiE
VACGSGNAALRAAAAGARVVGVDLTPELFDAGRKLAAEAGVEVDWVEGDAEDLPFPDESFDVVVSTFGCMFAPRHEVAAREIARVLRPGGRMCIACWTPEGTVGQLFKTTAQYMPPPPEVGSPPVLWGTEDHVRALFEGTGVEVEFERDAVNQRHDDTPAEAIELMTEKFGPMIGVRRYTQENGTWNALYDELLVLLERADNSEYLVTVGRKS